MGKSTNIAWTHSTFSPWIGCAKVSAACRNCYAENYALRFEGARPGGATWGVDGVRRRTSAANWSQVRRWNREAAASGQPWRVFCASLADVFEGRADLNPWRADLWELIEETPALTWLLLTKRPENVSGMVPPEWIAGEAVRVVVDPGQRLRDGTTLPAREETRITAPTWPPHVWIGTSWEEERESWRLDELEMIPAAVRFVSCEPLLDLLDLSRYCSACDGTGWDYSAPEDNPETCPACEGDCREIRNIQWVIAGGESGPRARRTSPDWFDQLQGQCRRAKIPYHFKQTGVVLAGELGLVHTKGGDLGELPERWRVREVPG